MLPLPAATRMGPVELAVRDLDAQVRFYRDLLGMKVHAHAAREAKLGSSEVLLHLRAEPDAPPRPRGGAGLFHVAYLVPTRADLGRAIAHLVRSRYPLEGASDHEFSEALYLSDPEGNGIEIYADRPRSLWPRFEELTWARMGPQPMDVEAVLGEGAGAAWAGFPAQTRVGHVHLNVNDVAAADRFYQAAVGFDRVIELPGSASFLSAGGYHHHVAVNNWGTRGGPPNTGESLGLRAITVELPEEAHEAALERLGAETVADPSGNRVRLARA
jgi:catechol 2,3-dioxygenase